MEARSLLEPEHFRILFHMNAASSFKTQSLPTVFQCPTGGGKSLQSNTQTVFQKNTCSIPEDIGWYYLLTNVDQNCIVSTLGLALPPHILPLVSQDTSAIVRRYQTFLCVVASPSLNREWTKPAETPLDIFSNCIAWQP